MFCLRKIFPAACSRASTDVVAAWSLRIIYDYVITEGTGLGYEDAIKALADRVYEKKRRRPPAPVSRAAAERKDPYEAKQCESMEPSQAASGRKLPEECKASPKKPFWWLIKSFLIELIRYQNWMVPKCIKVKLVPILILKMKSELIELKIMKYLLFTVLNLGEYIYFWVKIWSRFSFRSSNRELYFLFYICEMSVQK